MRQKPFLLMTIILAALPTSFASGHHTASAFYDLNSSISVEGTITGSKLSNPHSYYRVSTDDGEDWAMEAAGSWTQLQKAGWTQETLPEGTRVRVSGSPARDGKPLARYDTIAVLYDDGGIDLYGGRRGEWVGRARELGQACDNGVDGCLSLDADALMDLQSEFGNIGVWSPLDQE